MNALTKPSFQFPKLGVVLTTLNETVQKKTLGRAKLFGAKEQSTVLDSCQWSSLSDVRRHRHAKFLHHIRVVQNGNAIKLLMMHFKPPKSATQMLRIDLQQSHLHVLCMERSSDGIIERVSFGLGKGTAPESIEFTQSMEGSMARQFTATLVRGWLGHVLPKDDLHLFDDHVEQKTSAKTNASKLQALMEPSSILMAHAATMHQRMLRADGYNEEPAVARAIDQAVLHMYEKGSSLEHASRMFGVQEGDVQSRKIFFDRMGSMLNKSPSQMVVEHVLQSEHDEAMVAQGMRRTPDTPVLAACM